MANAFLNPTSVPGMWGDPIAVPTRVPAITRPGTMTSEHVAETNALATKPKAVAWVRMAPDILRAMATAAGHAGRSAGDIWAEAAREWLLRKSLEADYDVLSNAPARRGNDALDVLRTRLWTNIDSAMSDIRDPQAFIS